MGIQTMGVQGGGRQSNVQPLTKQASWFNLTFSEVGNHLANLGKPLGCMNLDELLRSLWSAEDHQTMKMEVDSDSSSATTLQRQSCLSLARSLSEKTVDEVWRDIQLGQMKKCGREIKGREKELSLGEMTLEDFLIQAAVFAEGLDTSNAMTPQSAMIPQSLPLQMVSSPSPSIGTQLDGSTSRRKRDSPDGFEKTVERRLKRMIKNRESAARSRARKQEYHNELVSKISRLEEDNRRLTKYLEQEKILPFDLLPEPKYQLRRTSSASF